MNTEYAERILALVLDELSNRDVDTSTIGWISFDEIVAKMVEELN